VNSKSILPIAVISMYWHCSFKHFAIIRDVTGSNFNYVISFINHPSCTAALGCIQPEQKSVPGYKEPLMNEFILAVLGKVGSDGLMNQNGLLK
jgi:hypothetical protein